jgi:hypothetical protein
MVHTGNPAPIRLHAALMASLGTLIISQVRLLSHDLMDRRTLERGGV